MSEQQAPAVGQVSGDGQFRWDGQQWTPIPKGEREPTPWTRPMQLATAAVFVCSAAYSLISTLLFVNHDSMLRAIRAQGTSIPAGSDVDTVVNIAVGFAIGTVVFISLLGVVAAVGSVLGWRWMFWAALILFGLSALSSLGNIQYFGSPDRSPIPIGAVAVGEIFTLLGVAVLVWMIVGLTRYGGPWATKKPGT